MEHIDAIEMTGKVKRMRVESHPHECEVRVYVNDLLPRNRGWQVWWSGRLHPEQVWALARRLQRECDGYEGAGGDIREVARALETVNND